MHACLKKTYLQESVTNVQGTEQGKAGAHLVPKAGPALTRGEWQRYLEKIKRGEDEYDLLFQENRELIEEMVESVEARAEILQSDVQNIHFDLNSLNVLVDQEGHAVIMDFDTIRLGTVHTDISFAFHRLITTCIEQTQCDREEIPKLIEIFLAAYKKGNPQVDFNFDQLAVAMCDRALWNIQTNLSLKYDQEEGSPDWLSAIPLNLKRLKQVKYLISIFKSYWESRTGQASALSG